MIPSHLSQTVTGIQDGGYTGIEYAQQSERQDERSVAQDVFNGFHDVTEGFSSGADDPINDFVLVSHTTAQEGPSWARSEE